MQHHITERLPYDMAKVVSILSYLTIIGWLLAIVIYGKNQSGLAKFHLQQSLGLIITGALLALLPLIGWMLSFGIVFLWCYGLVHAINGKRYHMPIIGDFYLNRLDFIN